jgi:hypothetical protein
VSAFGRRAAFKVSVIISVTQRMPGEISDAPVFTVAGLGGDGPGGVQGKALLDMGFEGRQDWGILSWSVCLCMCTLTHAHTCACV